MIPILTCTVGSPSLEVFEASVKTYCPDIDLIIDRNNAKNFGDAFNFALNNAFKKYDEIIVANDDIVLLPSSYKKLLEDIINLKNVAKIGWVAAKSDNVRPLQDIRHQLMDDIYEAPVVSPLFAYINKDAWIDYPPINWYSDDIQCIDMAKNGFKHFVSRAYVHHVGSTSIGVDHLKNHLESEPWIKANRPELHRIWFAPLSNPKLGCISDFDEKLD